MMDMDFEKLKYYRNTCNPYAQKLGIVIEELNTGYARATMRVMDDEVNPFGRAHGGCCFSLADITSGAACFTYGVQSATANASYNYLGAGKGGEILTAEAVTIKRGGHLCFFDVRVTNEEGKLIGTGCFTYYMFDKPLIIDTPPTASSTNG